MWYCALATELSQQYSFLFSAYFVYCLIHLPLEFCKWVEHLIGKRPIISLLKFVAFYILFLMKLVCLVH